MCRGIRALPADGTGASFTGGAQDACDDRFVVDGVDVDAKNRMFASVDHAAHLSRLAS